jgi:hypothetical protein
VAAGGRRKQGSVLKGTAGHPQQCESCTALACLVYVPAQLADCLSANACSCC